MSKLVFIPLLFLLLISTGCGVKGNPVPYVDTHSDPKAPQEQGK